MPIHADRVCVVQQITSFHSYFGHMGCQSLTATACSLSETCASLQDDQTGFEVSGRTDGSQADGAARSQLLRCLCGTFHQDLRGRLCAGQSQYCALAAL